MSVEFIHLRDIEAKDVDYCIAENICKFLYGRDEEEGEEEKDVFKKGFKAARKEGRGQLISFVLKEGKTLIEQDPNSSLPSNKDYYLYLQCIGIFLLSAKEEEREEIANSVINQLKIDLKDNSVLYIKMYERITQPFVHILMS